MKAEQKCCRPGDLLQPGHNVMMHPQCVCAPAWCELLTLNNHECSVNSLSLPCAWHALLLELSRPGTQFTMMVRWLISRLSFAHLLFFFAAANRLMWSPTVSHSHFAGTLTLTWEVLLNSEEIDFETRYLEGKSISSNSVQTSISSL